MNHRSALLASLWGVLWGVGLIAASGAHAAPHVAVTVNLGGPEIYGQVQIGRVAPPVIYAQPVVIVQPEIMLPRQPIYLRVPPGYERDWARYCAVYAACSQPVYFVRARPGADRYERRQDEHDHHHQGERRGEQHDEDDQD